MGTRSFKRKDLGCQEVLLINDDDTGTYKGYVRSLKRAPLRAKGLFFCDDLEKMPAPNDEQLAAARDTLGDQFPYFYDMRMGPAEKRLTARAWLVNRNRGLVGHCYGQFRLEARRVGTNLEEKDVMQQGRIGLMHALEKYDFTMGGRFSTYAVYWIRQEMWRFVDDTGSTIRVPVHMREAYVRYRYTKRLLWGRLHRRPTRDELCEAMGISPQKLRILREVGALLKTKNFSAFENNRHQKGDGLIDPFWYEQLGEVRWATDGSGYRFWMERVDRTDVEERLERPMADERVRQILFRATNITPRELKVLQSRFGIGQEDAQTLEEVAQDSEVTRERIRQIEAKALRKLRHPSCSKKFDEEMARFRPWRSLETPLHELDNDEFAREAIDVVCGYFGFDDRDVRRVVHGQEHRRAVQHLVHFLAAHAEWSPEQIGEFLDRTVAWVLNTLRLYGLRRVGDPSFRRELAALEECLTWDDEDDNDEDEHE